MAAAFCMRLFNDNCVGFVNRQCATNPACRRAWRGSRRRRASRNGHGETAGGGVQAGMGAARQPVAASKPGWARRGGRRRSPRRNGRDAALSGRAVGRRGACAPRLAGGPVGEIVSDGVAARCRDFSGKPLVMSAAAAKACRKSLHGIALSPLLSPAPALLRTAAAHEGEFSDIRACHLRECLCV